MEKYCLYHRAPGEKRFKKRSTSVGPLETLKRVWRPEYLSALERGDWEIRKVRGK